MSPGMATPTVYADRCRVSRVAWERSGHQRTHDRPAAGDEHRHDGTQHGRQQDDQTAAQHFPATPLLDRSTTSPTVPGVTIPGESSVTVGRVGNTGVHPGAVQEADPHIAGPCGRERVRTQMTETLTTTPAADDLVVPLHCDRCGALAKVRVVLASGSDLVFCGHHAREYESKLRDIAVDIIQTDGELRLTT